MSNYRKLIPKTIRRSVKHLLSKMSTDIPARDNSVHTIGICAPQVPFSYGGAENLNQALHHELKNRGYDVDLITMPYKWYPHEQILNSIKLWQQLDLSEADGKKIDLLITTKFPSYFVNHPNKVLWLVHQFRQIYDLFGTPYSGFAANSKADMKLRQAIADLDRKAIQIHKRVFTISQNVSQRLQKFNGLNSTTLYHPPKLHPRYYHQNYGDYILSVGRLDKLKRVDWLIRSLPLCPESMR
jgi:glycosyltransferase involved in cell wall biosynthesis